MTYAYYRMIRKKESFLFSYLQTTQLSQVTRFCDMEMRTPKRGKCPVLYSKETTLYLNILIIALLGVSLHFAHQVKKTCYVFLK